MSKEGAIYSGNVNICSADLAGKVVRLCNIIVEQAIDVVEGNEKGQGKLWDPNDPLIDVIYKVGSILHKMHSIEKSLEKVDEDNLQVNREDIIIAMKFCNTVLKKQASNKRERSNCKQSKI